MSGKHIVFDIGGVLIDWDPALAFVEACGGRDAAEAFMARADFKQRNARADNGASFADLANEIDAPDDREIFASYVANYQLTLQRRIDGTWDILDRLKANGTPVHAITNWSAETWPEGVAAQPRLGQVFETLVVSGQEGIMKPDRRIFDLFCKRTGVAHADCLFTDDGQHNVDGARAAGMDAVQFTSPAQLERDLTARGLL